MNNSDNYISSLSSKTIDLLRFPLAVMVVFIHSFGLSNSFSVGDLQTSPLTSIDIYNFIRVCFSKVLPNIAVPSFFLISGYLFFKGLDRWDKDIYLSKVKKRLYTLLIPYIIWNTIALLYVVGKKCFGGVLHNNGFNIVDYFNDHGWFRVFWDSHTMNDSYINWLMLPVSSTAPFNVPLWFIRDLIVVIALSPMLYWILKWSRGFALIPLLLAFISGVWIEVSGISIISIFFFSVGAFLSIEKIDLSTYFKRFSLLGYTLAPVCLMCEVYWGGQITNFGNWINPFYIIFGVIAVFNIAALLAVKGVSLGAFFGSSSFFIFSVHNFAIRGACQDLVRKLFPDNILFNIFGYFCAPCLCVVICLLLYFMLRRYFPKMSSLLTGNR